MVKRSQDNECHFSKKTVYEGTELKIQVSILAKCQQLKGGRKEKVHRES